MHNTYNPEQAKKQESELAPSIVLKRTLESIKIPPGSRKVLVKILEKTIDQATPSGIYKISPTDTDWNPAKHRNRWGVVLAAPKRPLPFKVKGDLMPWSTKVQITPGMTVFFDFMNTQTYNDEEGSEYKLVDYDSLYVATFPRVDDEELGWAHKSTDGTEWIVPLNGFCLFERIYKKQRGTLDIFETHKIDRRRGIVKYVAEKNVTYEDGMSADHVDLKVGDEVVFSSVPEVMLEDETYCVFDGGRMYRRAQARNVDLIWRNRELILPTGKVLLKQIPDETVTPSGIILQKPNVKNHTGEIILSSVHEIKEKDVVLYIKGAGVKLEYKGEDCRVVKEGEILYVE